MNNLYNYIFWFNPYEDMWYAVPRDQYTLYFSDRRKDKGVLKSTKIDTLIYIIHNPEVKIEE